MNKRKISLGILGLAMVLTFSGCSKKGKDKVDEAEKKIEDQVDKVEDKIEEKTENVEKDLEKEERRDTELRVVGVFDEIVEKNFEGKVSLDDYKVDIDSEDPKKLDGVEFSLFLDVENEEEAKKLVEEYSELFEKEFAKKENFEDLSLKWRMQGNDEIIEKNY